jgi:hypothetical protein
MSPNAGGGCGVSDNEYCCAHGAQIIFGDLTPYLTYSQVGLEICISLIIAVYPHFPYTVVVFP